MKKLPVLLGLIFAFGCAAPQKDSGIVFHWPSSTPSTKSESPGETPETPPPTAEEPKTLPPTSPPTAEEPTAPPPPPPPKTEEPPELPKLADLLDLEKLKKRFPDLWAKVKKQYPNLPLEKLLPKVPEALQKESLEPLIEAYCLDKSPNKEGMVYKGCIMVGKGLAKQECAKAKGKIEEACKKFGKVCENPMAKETIEKVLKACEKASN